MADSLPTAAPGTEPGTSARAVLRSVEFFYAIACGWAWLAWAPVVCGGEGLKLIPITPSLPVLTCVATLGPFLACFVAHRRECGSWRAVHLWPRTPAGWLWLAVGPLLVLVGVFAIFPALISQGPPDSWHWHPRVLAGLWLPMFNYNLFGGPLFEEFGWRGFLQPRLEKLMRPWLAAICVGAMWAAWHLPLFLVGWSSASPLLFLFIVVGLAVWMACGFHGSGNSVVAAILMHSAFNSSPRFLGPFLGDTATREHPPAEFYLGLAFLILAFVAVVFTRGRLQADRHPGPQKGNSTA